MNDSNNLRILVCGTQVPFIRGGAEKLVDTLVLKLREKGHIVDTVMIPFQWYPKENILRTSLAWRLLDVTESAHQPIDLLIATKFPSYFVKHPNKVVWLVHQHRASFDHYTTPYTPLKNTPEDHQLREEVMKYEKDFLAESKALFAISKNVADRAERFLGLDAEPLYPPLYHPEKYSSRKSGGYILSVSRLEQDKRVDLLIKALALTKSDAKAKIVGTGSQLETLKKEAEALGIKERVEFLGFVPENKIYGLYASSHAVFFAPWDEDYGYITIEAFQSKKPVITSDQSGGVLEFVEDGVNGFVTDGSPKDIARAIDRLYKKPQLAVKMGERGYKTVEPITWDHVIEKLLAR
jgi:glycosyltransferase involved in cell wall biosynthesis